MRQLAGCVYVSTLIALNNDPFPLPNGSALPDREGRGREQNPTLMQYPFHAARLTADSLYALLATPIEFQLEVLPPEPGAALVSARVRGDGFPPEVQEAFGELILDWEATIAFSLPAAAGPPPGLYALTLEDEQLHAVSDERFYPIADRQVELVLSAEEED